MMFSGMSSLPGVCHPARSSSRTAWAPQRRWRDFVEMELHHVGVGIGQGKRRPDAAGGEIAPNR